MRCPNCASENNKVLESREVDDGIAIRRRRHCLDCDGRFTTYERIEMHYLLVIKKNGDREPYTREKLQKGMYKAFEKRPISVETIELLISRVEQQLQSLGEPEIPSVTIGEMVIEQIMQTDAVAYVRFASVYRSFTDISSFEKELKRVKRQSIKNKKSIQ